MTAAGWRNIALALAVICGVQQWRSCTRSTTETLTRALSDRRTAPGSSTDAAHEPAVRPADPPAPRLPADEGSARTGRSLYGFKIPAWAMHLAPQPGETMRDYRDRILPLAQRVIAPQRARVARMRDDFAALDAHQRAELDGAVREAASAIQDRVMNGLLSGELRPATLKPMTGVTMARDVLDIVERGNTRFQNALTPDQRARLTSHRFDFADYLLFSAHWEDALHVLD